MTKEKKNGPYNFNVEPLPDDEHGSFETGKMAGYRLMVKTVLFELDHFDSADENEKYNMARKIAEISLFLDKSHLNKVSKKRLRSFIQDHRVYFENIKIPFLQKENVNEAVITSDVEKTEMPVLESVYENTGNNSSDIEDDLDKSGIQNSESLDFVLDENSESKISNEEILDEEISGEIGEESISSKGETETQDVLSETSSFFTITGQYLHLPDKNWIDKSPVQERKETSQNLEKAGENVKRKSGFLKKKKKLTLKIGNSEEIYDGYYDPIEPIDADRIKTSQKFSFTKVHWGLPVLIGGMSFAAIGCFIMPFIT